MDRRDFMKMCSVAGLGLVATGLPGSEKKAHAAEPVDQFFVAVNASGGWDHTMFLTPKGNSPNSQGVTVNRLYAGPAVSTTAPNIDYAPDVLDAQGAFLNGLGIEVKKPFFDTYGSVITILRGVNHRTNGHDAGQRVNWSGRLTDGTASFGALLAAALGSERPLSYITNGGYSFTDGKISQTRLGDTDALDPLIFPNRTDPGDPNSNLHLTDETFQRVLATRQERLNRYQQLQNLPRIKNSMSLLYTSRLGMADIKKIKDYLPTDPNLLGNGMARQATIAIAAWLAGLATTATLSRGGFDTHGGTDPTTEANIADYVQGVQALLQVAESFGVADRLVIMGGSDFGRTPDYNGADGKDHHNVGASFLIGRGISGNRVVGGTTDNVDNRNINPTTFAVDDAGQELRPGHIHRWLRNYFGITDHEVVRTVPIQLEDGEVDINLGMPG